MKKFLIAIFVAFMPIAAFSQDFQDSLRVKIDSANVNIINDLQSNAGGRGHIEVDQNIAVARALQGHVTYNLNNQTTKGWRIRIYSDNGQNARAVSNSIMSNFHEKYPDTPTYKTYKSPYFSVSVGDFTTKEDAEIFRYKIKPDYPNAYIIAEDKINLPIL